MPYTNISTAYDVCKETLIYGAELDGKYGFPVLESCETIPAKTVNFRKSLKLNKVRDLNINFFMHDQQFLSVWNNPDKYMEHFRCFHSICGFDFSIDTKSPLALQIYNKYRNHVLSWYFQSNGVNVIPNVDILPGCSDWIYDGLPKNSLLCCGTKGRVNTLRARREFKECFAEMESVLRPHTVILVGGEIDIDTSCNLIQFEDFCKNETI